jgi:hypothetical protein
MDYRAFPESLTAVFTRKAVVILIPVRPFGMVNDKEFGRRILRLESQAQLLDGCREERCRRRWIGRSSVGRQIKSEIEKSGESGLVDHRPVNRRARAKQIVEPPCQILHRRVTKFVPSANVSGGKLFRSRAPPV